jgi:hypothetical protein
MAISRYPRLHLAVAHAGLLPLLFFALFMFPVLAVIVYLQLHYARREI